MLIFLCRRHPTPSRPAQTRGSSQAGVTTSCRDAAAAAAAGDLTPGCSPLQLSLADLAAAPPPLPTDPGLGAASRKAAFPLLVVIAVAASCAFLCVLCVALAALYARRRRRKQQVGKVSPAEEATR